MNSTFNSIVINDEDADKYEEIPIHDDDEQINLKTEALIAWKDITVTVTEWSVSKVAVQQFSTSALPKSLVPWRRKTILNRLTGTFMPGSLNGILGPSGAGKTTLLDVLSGTASSSLTTGTVYSQPETEVYYIRQQLAECIVGQLTVGQLLHYAYQFKVSSGSRGQRSKTSSELEHEQIRQTMAALMLPEELLNRTFDRCSGGEQKRIAIAQEILDPFVEEGDDKKEVKGQGRRQKILYLDEPTTGLDSASAAQVMHHLKNLTQKSNFHYHNRITIVATIHAPSDEVLSLFNHIYVLAKEGVAVYSGPPGGIRSTLEGTIQTTISSQQPPIEALLKVACDGPTSPEVHRLATVTQLTEEAALQAQLKRSSPTLLPASNLSHQTSGQTFNFCCLWTHLCRQLRITFHAQLTTFLFQPLLFTLFFAFLYSLFSTSSTSSENETVSNKKNPYSVDGRLCIRFPPTLNSSSFETTTTESISPVVCNVDESPYQQNDPTQRSVHYLAYVLLISGFTVLIIATSLYSKTLKSLQAEHRNRWYSLGVFYTSTMIVTALELSITVLLITTLSYFLSGQHSVDAFYQRADNADHFWITTSLNWTRFSFYLLFIALLCFYVQAIGQLIGSLLVDHPTLALLLVQLVYSSSCLFNGTYVNLKRIAPDSWLLHLASDLLGVIFTTKGVFYAIFVEGRCGFPFGTTHYSKIVVDFDIEAGRVWEYAARVAVNILLLKMLTFAALYCKFSASFERCKRKSSEPLNEKEEKEVQQANGSNFSFKYDNHLFSASVVVVVVDEENNVSSFRNKNNKVSNHSESSSKKISFQLPTHNSTIQNTDGNQIAIAWRNLTFFADTGFFLPGKLTTGNSNTAKTPILSQLNGQFNVGSLNAILGTSGAGKTTLLKVLSGQAEISGHLSDSSQIYLRRGAPTKTAFISQEVSDHLLSGLTSRQLLLYSSKLKNVNSKKKVNHGAIADRWLKELGLESASDTPIDRCSGGERKRVAVALELTALEMPNLVFIDEPTSGLDTNSAEIVIAALKKLSCHHPLTIITSIHQPTSTVLFTFDLLYVLSRGGACIFSGTPELVGQHLDHCHHLISGQFFSSTYLKHFAFPIEELVYQSCFEADEPMNLRLAEATNYQFMNNSTNSELLEQTVLTVDGISKNRTRFSLQSVWALAQRTVHYIAGYLWTEWVAYFLVSMIFGTLLRTSYPPEKISAPDGCVHPMEDDFCGPRSPEQVERELFFRDNFVYNYFYATIFILVTFFTATFSTFREYAVFRSEHRNGYYSTGVYYLVKSVVEVIPLVFTNLFYVLVVNIYDGAVVSFSSIYWPLFALLTLGQVTIVGLAHVFTLVGGGHLGLTTLLACSAYLFFILIGNTYVPVEEMHYVYQGLAWFSVPRYTIETIMLMLYGFGRCPAEKGAVPAVLYSMGISEEDFGWNYLKLGVVMVVFRVAAFWLLVRKVNGGRSTGGGGKKERSLRLEQYRASRLMSSN